MSDPSAMLQHLFESARSAPFVADNDAYCASVSSVRLVYDRFNLGFNALATELPSQTDEGSSDSLIIIFEGYVFWGRIASAAIGGCLTQRTGSPAPAIRAQLEKLSPELCADVKATHTLSPHIARWIEILETNPNLRFDEFIKGVPEIAPLWSELLARRGAVVDALPTCLSTRGALAEARTVLEGMLSWVIAHEIGHVCMQHTRGSRDQKGWGGITRNQEREADSFASSLLQSRLSRHALLLGALLGELLTAWSRIGGDGSGTHPHSSERYHNLIRSMPSAVADASAIYLLAEGDWELLLP